MNQWAVSMEGRRRRKTIRWDLAAKAAVVSILFLLIMAQVFSSAAGKNLSISSSRRWSPARKFRFEMAPYHARSSSPSPRMMGTDRKNEDNLYEEEKRLVQTGPNPLHN